MTPRVRALYRAFRRRLAACGPIYAAPAQTRIAFLARVRFAGVTAIGRDSLTITFALPRPLRGRRFASVAEVAPGWWVHRLRITHVEQLDAPLQRWLERSYRLMGMQERLAERPARTRITGAKGPAVR